MKYIIPTKNPDKKSVLKSMNLSMKPNVLKKVKSATIVNELVKFENLMTVDKFKFGILSVKSLQKKEEEMFSNGTMFFELL